MADSDDKDTELRMRQTDAVHAAGRCLRLGFDSDSDDLNDPLAMLMIHLSHVPYEAKRERQA